MRAPDFWSKPQPDFRARLLGPAGRLYGAVTGARMARPGQRCGAPVICVGNFTLGGSGKTPTASCIAEALIGMGERPVFLSRGHGGATRSTPVRVDLSRHHAADVGDEPLLLARLAPIIVCADRIAGAAAAIAAGATVLVMDDGMQNPTLHKDVTFAVVDGAVGVGNGLCFPAGPLRAPLAAQWGHIDALVVVGEGEAGDAVVAQAGVRPCLRAGFVAAPESAATLRQRRVLAFAGIGRPEKFFATLRDLGAEIVASREYPDHHRYSASELATLLATARSLNADLVTTEKDRVRLPADFNAVALPVRLDFADASALREILVSCVSRASRHSRAE